MKLTKGFNQNRNKGHILKIISPQCDKISKTQGITEIEGKYSIGVEKDKV